MKKNDQTDTKPLDYNYLTFRLISSVSHQDKADLLTNLEKMLLKNLMTGFPGEGPTPMEFVRTYECRIPSRALTVWASRLLPELRLSRKLVKTSRFRWN